MSRAVETIRNEYRKHFGDDRPILIGQAPSRHGDPTKPLTGSAGKKLARLAGLPPLEFYVATVRVNVFDEWPGHLRGWDAFPVKEARERALEIGPYLVGRRAVFVGRMVAQAFECDTPWFEWSPERSPVLFRCACFPHPSGRSVFWNGEGSEERASKFLRELLACDSDSTRLRRLRERARAISEARGF